MVIQRVVFTKSKQEKNWVGGQTCVWGCDPSSPSRPSWWRSAVTCPRRTRRCTAYSFCPPSVVSWTSGYAPWSPARFFGMSSSASIPLSSKNVLSIQSDQRVLIQHYYGSLLIGWSLFSIYGRVIKFGTSKPALHSSFWHHLVIIPIFFTRP